MKKLMTIKRTGKNRDEDISVTAFDGPNKIKMIQLKQGRSVYSRPDKPESFIQLSKDDAKVAALALHNFIEIDYGQVFSAAKKFSDAWREWHKPEYGSFPSDELITAANELDALFPGIKAGEDQ